MVFFRKINILLYSTQVVFILRKIKKEKHFPIFINKNCIAICIQTNIK